MSFPYVSIPYVIPLPGVGGNQATKPSVAPWKPKCFMFAIISHHQWNLMAYRALAGYFSSLATRYITGISG